MTAAFLDTGYLVALHVADDQHHEDAVRHWNAFVRTRAAIVTTSYILGEVVTFLVSCDRHDMAVGVAEDLLSSSRIELVHVDEDLLRAGLAYSKRRPDKRYSFTDCVSFVLMQRLEIRAALAFDHHFEQAGFRRLPLEPR